MHSRTPFTLREALYNVFLANAVKPPPSNLRRLRPNALSYFRHTRRHASASTRLKPTAPTTVTKTMLKHNPIAGLDPTKVILDENIGARSAHLVTAHSDGNTFQEAQPLSSLLRSIDRTTSHLRKVGETKEGIPVVRIVTKEALREEARNMARQKTVKKVDDLVKQVELNWAITENDLNYRLNWIERFIGEGRRVEVLIAPKRGGRRATKDEIESLLARVRQAIADVEEGAEEWKAMQGPPGGQVTIYVQPKDGGGKAKGEKEAKRKEGKEGRLEKKEQEKREKQEKLERRLAKKKEEEERLEKERKEKLGSNVAP